MKRYSGLGWVLGWSSIACVLCFGCHTRNHEAGDISFSFGTTFTISHHGPENDEAQVGIDAPPWMQKPVVDWIIKLDDPSAEPGGE